MNFTRLPLALVWFVVLGLFVMSASGMIEGGNAWWLIIGALVTPAIILTLFVERHDAVQ